MPAKRKGADKLALPVVKQSAKKSTKLLVDESRAAISTAAHPVRLATSTKAKIPETIEISSGASDDDEYDTSDQEDNASDHVDMETSHPDHRPEPAEAEEDDSDNAPTFADLVHANGTTLINVPPALAAEASTSLMNGAHQAPSLSSLGTVLTQALRTDDNDLLESCFRVSDINTVRNTIQRIDSVLAGSLVSKLAARIYRRPGRAGTLMSWVQWTLVCHGGALAKEPDLVVRLADLNRVLKDRAEGLNSLLMLKGKLDMLESQMVMRRAIRKQKITTGAAEGQEGDGEEGIIYVESESDDDGKDEEMADAIMPLVNGVGSDDSEDDGDEDDQSESEDDLDGDVTGDDDEVKGEDQESEDEDDEDSDVGDAAAPPAKTRKTGPGLPKRR